MEKCYDRDGQAMRCSTSKANQMWFAGMVFIVLFEAACVYFGHLVIKSIFGYDIFDFRNRVNYVIVVGILLFIMGFVGLYVYEKGFIGVGLNHAGIDTKLMRKIKAKEAKSTKSEYYAKFEDRRLNSGESTPLAASEHPEDAVIGTLKEE